MIVYVDLEHDRLRQQPELYQALMARRLEQKYRFEDISGDLCLLVRYWRVNPDLLRQLGARAVVVSGAATDFEHYNDKDLEGLRAVYQEAAWPTLGLCAGHQLMALACRAGVDAMGPLPQGALDPFQGTTYPQGVKQERGFMPVRLVQTHPLFAGLGQEAVFYESHYWEVKSLPAGFRALAETDLCCIQAMAHDERPLFGVQFHPEENDDANPAGRRLLANFFRVAGVMS